MGSTLQEEIKRQMERLAAIASAPKQEPTPAPKVVDEQRKLAGIEPSVPAKIEQLLEDTRSWRLDKYAKSISVICEELEQRLQSTVKGLEKYTPSGPKETELKPGKNLKDLRGAAKELQAKLIQARRIASGIEAELLKT